MLTDPKHMGTVLAVPSDGSSPLTRSASTIAIASPLAQRHGAALRSAGSRDHGARGPSER
jgi:hypothetical protein